MTRLAGCAVTTILFFALGTPVFAQNSPVKKQRPNFSFGLEAGGMLGFHVTKSIKEVRNIPVPLRQLPSHPDDTWIYGSRQVIKTIPYDSLDASHGMNLDFDLSVSPELALWRFRVKSGVVFSMVGASGMREINQYGSPNRGEGTSLVYYSLVTQPSKRLGLVHGVDYRISGNFFVLAGHSRSFHNLAIETGYDRWNSYDGYETRKIASGTARKTYGGFGWQSDGTGSISLVVGKTKTTYDLNELGKGLILDYKDNWYTGLNISFHPTFFKK